MFSGLLTLSGPTVLRRAVGTECETYVRNSCFGCLGVATVEVVKQRIGHRGVGNLSTSGQTFHSGIVQLLFTYARKHVDFVFSLFRSNLLPGVTHHMEQGKSAYPKRKFQSVLRED